MLTCQRLHKTASLTLLFVCFFFCRRMKGKVSKREIKKLLWFWPKPAKKRPRKKSFQTKRNEIGKSVRQSFLSVVIKLTWYHRCYQERDSDGPRPGRTLFGRELRPGPRTTWFPRGALPTSGCISGLRKLAALPPGEEKLNWIDGFDWLWMHWTRSLPNVCFEF